MNSGGVFLFLWKFSVMYLQRIKDKIFPDFKAFKPILEEWKGKGEKIVFTNGCFDLVHRGHIEYLAQAAGKGDRLIIGLNTDASVRRLKGPQRPVSDEISRALVLASLFTVSAVILFDEDTPLELITNILPDILVKGNDYAPHEIAGADIVIAAGGTVETISLVGGYSSSLFIRKIKETPDE